MAEKDVASIRYGRIAPCLEVREIHSAHDFYTQVLGFEKIFENGSPVGFMALKKDKAELHLSQKSDFKPTTTNVAHLFVDDVAALYDHCKQHGVRIVKSLAYKDYGQQAFVLTDPDGNRIDIGQRSDLRLTLGLALDPQNHVK